MDARDEQLRSEAEAIAADPTDLVEARAVLTTMESLRATTYELLADRAARMEQRREREADEDIAEGRTTAFDSDTAFDAFLEGRQS